jgi:two-component system LytT family sensor kinase
MILRSPRLRLLTVAFWLLFGAVSGLQIQISMLAHHHSWGMLLGYQVLVWSVWIVYSRAIGALLERVPLAPARPGPIALHLSVALVLAALHAVIWVGIELWLKPYDFMNPRSFSHRFEKMAIWLIPFEILLYGLVALAHHVIAATARERERERRAAQLETSLAEARLHALELQVRPHFLFNTLNGIGSLVRGGQTAEAMGMIGGLSDLLRYSLDHGGGSRVTLEEEATMVERYLDIQRLRFPDRLVVELDLPPETLRAEVPVLLLQPLAENAIQHGIARSNAGGRVTVRARRHDAELWIEVFNTGTLPARVEPGIGLSTTTSRLAQMYGDGARLELLEQSGGVVARVRVPWSAR